MNTKRIIQSVTICFISVVMSACEKIDIPKEELMSTYDQVYMAAAARNPNSVVLKMADSVYYIVYGASFGGFGAAPQDIGVTFETDPSKAAAFNSLNGTNYPLLPEGSYQFTETSATIKKGTLATAPLAIRINPFEKLELFKDYILAVSIKGASGGVKLNESLTTAYFVVRASLDFADFPELDRSGWQIAGISTEEPAEGEENGGLGIHMLDNKPSTFWHSKWDGGEAPLPHWFVIDMNKTQLLHGVYFIGRQSDKEGKPSSVKMEVSGNGTDWEEAGTLSPANINSKQKFFLSASHECRYIRATILSTHGNTQFSHLAEFGAF